MRHRSLILFWLAFAWLAAMPASAAPPTIGDKAVVPATPTERTSAKAWAAKCAAVVSKYASRAEELGQLDPSKGALREERDLTEAALREVDRKLALATGANRQKLRDERSRLEKKLAALVRKQKNSGIYQAKLRSLLSCSQIEPVVSYCSAESAAMPSFDRLSNTSDALAAPETFSGTCADLDAPAVSESADSGIAAATAAWQDAAIRGLAAFVTKRAKAEALTSIRRRLAKELCSDEAKPYFPATCAVIGADDSESEGPRWVTLKAALERDLVELPARYVEQAQAAGESSPRVVIVADLFLVAMRAADALRRGESVVSIIAGFVDSYSAAAADGNAAATALVVFGVAAQVLAQDGGFAALPTASALGFRGKSAAKLRDTAAIAADRFYDLARKHGVHESICGRDESGEACATRVATALVELNGALIEVVAAAKEAADAKSAEERREAYFNYVRSFAAAFETGTGLAFPDANPDLCRGASPHVPSCVRIGAAAVAHAVDAADAARRRDYGSSVVSLIQAANALANTDKLPPWFRRHLSFAVDVASARTPEEFEKVLESTAAPLGSFRSKRGNPRIGQRFVTRDKAVPGRWTVGFNAYVGVTGGVELLVDDDLVGSLSLPTGTVSLFAPVGLEGSVGIWRHSSLSLFLPVLDVGGLADFRTQPTEDASAGIEDGASTTAEVAQQPNLTFAQVLSPGAYLVLGLGRVPVSLGAGFSYTPKLRKVVVGGRDSEASALQVGAFLAIDIPLYIFART